MTTVDRRDFLTSTAAAGLAISSAARAAARPSDDDPLGIRGEFPVTETEAYLNSCAVGPLPQVVHDAAVAYAGEKMRHPAPGRRREAMRNARARFAKLFGCDEEELAFLFSTSDGENIVVHALDWKEGDNVVLDELHFTTSFVLYRELEKRLGVELRIIRHQDGRAPLEAYEARTDERTRLITVAWVSNRNGYRYDVKALSKLAHAHGAYLYADAIQAFGLFPIDLHDEGVDFACGNSYKWLHADYGVAPFYVRREHLDWLKPDRFGHSQIVEALPDMHYRLDATARKFEYANVANGSMRQLEASLAFIADVGLENIEQHTVSLAKKLRRSLDERGFELFTPPGNASPIVTFVHGFDPDRLYEALLEEKAIVSFRERGTQLRAGVGMFNNESDVDRLLHVLDGLS